MTAEETQQRIYWIEACVAQYETLAIDKYTILSQVDRIQELRRQQKNDTPETALQNLNHQILFLEELLSQRTYVGLSETSLDRKLRELQDLISKRLSLQAYMQIPIDTQTKDSA